MTDKRYSVGQVLFIGSNKKNQVIPVQVTELLTRETVDGMKVTYSVVTPKHLDRPIDLSKVEGQIFTSLEEAKTKMVANAERASRNFLEQAKKEIERMIRVAASASNKFPNAKRQEIQDDDLQIDITDEAQSYEPAVPTEKKLQRLQQLTPPPSQNDSESVIMVPGPDGTEIPAKIRSIRVSAKD